MNPLSLMSPSHRFWFAVGILVAYVGLGVFFSRFHEHINTAIAYSVLSTLGPVVGAVVQAVFGIQENQGASGKPEDPVHIEEGDVHVR